MKLYEVYNLRPKVSILETKMGIKREDIKELFYHPDQKLQQRGVQPCFLRNYDVIWGDFRTGVRYQDGDETYYMFLSANTKHALPQQIAVGKVQDDMVYMMREHFPNGAELDLFAFPEEIIDQPRIQGFLPRCYRDSISCFVKQENDVNSEWKTIPDLSRKCLSSGMMATKTFGAFATEQLVITKLQEFAQENKWRPNFLFQEIGNVLSRKTVLALQKEEHLGCSCCFNEDCMVPACEKMEEGVGQSCIGFSNPELLGEAYVKKYGK